MGRIFDFYENNENYREEPKFPVPISQAGNATVYHCKWHDYVYYPKKVKNAEGVRYRAGYYDETGKYYSELKLYHSFPEEGLVCKYCGHRMTEDELEGMETLKCPNCDASFELVTPADVVKKDKVVMSEVAFTDKSEAQAKRYVHMPDNRLVSTGDALRQRAAYDPDYDADSGTDFDKKNDFSSEENREYNTLFDLPPYEYKGRHKVKGWELAYIVVFLIAVFFLFKFVI